MLPGLGILRAFRRAWEFPAAWQQANGRREKEGGEKKATEGKEGKRRRERREREERNERKERKERKKKAIADSV